jgi:hypothetical protein
MTLQPNKGGNIKMYFCTHRPNVKNLIDSMNTMISYNVIQRLKVKAISRKVAAQNRVRSCKNFITTKKFKKISVKVVFK